MKKTPPSLNAPKNTRLNSHLQPQQVYSKKIIADLWVCPLKKALIIA